MPQTDETKTALDSSDFRGHVVSALPVGDIGLPDSESLTYERYFGLRNKPFSLSPDPKFFFSNPSRRTTLDSLVAGIRRREGILAVSGEAGTGKTTLCHAVLHSLDQKPFTAFVPDPLLSREDLLKILLIDFGVISLDDIRSGRLQGVSRTDLSYQLHEFLASPALLQTFAVVMIDDAQNLPTHLIEEIRILADLEDRHRLLQLLLIGQPQLESHLRSPQMRQLNQRVSVRIELSPLDEQDVAPYISHRLAIAGNRGALQFAAPAVELIYRASSGLPRVINVVCDGALLRAARARRMIVQESDVLGALNELNLPVGLNLPPLPREDQQQELEVRGAASETSRMPFDTDQRTTPLIESGDKAAEPIQGAPFSAPRPFSDEDDIPPPHRFQSQKLFGEDMREASVGSMWEAPHHDATSDENGVFAETYWPRVLMVLIALLLVMTAVAVYYRVMPAASAPRSNTTAPGAPGPAGSAPPIDDGRRSLASP